MNVLAGMFTKTFEKYEDETTLSWRLHRAKFLVLIDKRMRFLVNPHTHAQYGRGS